MNKLCWITCLFVLSIVGCNNRSANNRQLAHIDSLLQHDLCDSAMLGLNALTPTAFDDENQAYYWLLRAEASYKCKMEPMPDSMLQTAIAYYDKTNNRARLAQSYFLKGVMQDEYACIDSALKYVKMAQRLAQKTNDRQLSHDVCIYLSYLNNVSGNLNLAIDYAHQAIGMAFEQQNKRWIGADYLQISSSYYHKNMKDSSNYYIDQLIPYLEYQPEKDLPDMLNNIAVSFLDRKNTPLAKQYLLRSLAIKPMEHTYYLLSVVYSEEGKVEEAEKLWQKALLSKNAYMKSKISRMYAEWLREQGNYQKAAEMTAQAEQLEDSINKSEMGEKALTAQTYYDQQSLSEEFGRRMFAVSVVVTVLIALVVGLWMYHKRAHKRATRQMANAKDATISLQNQIDGLENERQQRENILERQRKELEMLQQKVELLQSESSKQGLQAKELERKIREKTHELRRANEEHEQKNRELTLLRSRMQQLEKRQEDIMVRGKQLYVELMNDGNASQWAKDDAQHFLAYFAKAQPRLMQRIQNGYQQLSPRQEVIAILIEMGKSDDQLKQTLALSDGALRTAKSRINAKKTNLQEQ